jgi:hypothetical protein
VVQLKDMDNPLQHVEAFWFIGGSSERRVSYNIPSEELKIVNHIDIALKNAECLN